jgi:glycosyltransferase involved in cell wall biosynthesis
MRICFLNPGGLAYHADTPLHAPLGGSESALCYLALELADRGHTVSIVTAHPETRTVKGVTGYPDTELAQGLLQRLQPEAVILCNGPGGLREAMQECPEAVRIVWMHHLPDQPAAQSLPNYQAYLDQIVFVSEWQRQQFLTYQHLPKEKTSLLVNAIAPAFEYLFADQAAFIRAKTGPPTLAYTSHPGRGLNVLLAAFPLIHQEFPSVRLQVFASEAMYQRSPEQDAYQALYARCRVMPGVEYHGALPQPALAEAMGAVHLLTYPNTFAETGSIAVLEAMAAGCSIITTDQGALREMTSGWAHLVPPHPLDTFVDRFAAAVIDTLKHWIDNPVDSLKHLYQQRDQVRIHVSWEPRAWQWESLCMRLRHHW